MRDDLASLRKDGKRRAMRHHWLNLGKRFDKIAEDAGRSSCEALYTGGKLLRTVDSARHQLQAQRTEEARTAIDLKLTVAEAYVGVLRAKRNLDTAKSNVEQLASFARDVGNRLGQGLAIKSDDLAAKVSLANAQISEIQARTTLESAWATYNRYLCRPLDQFAELEEIYGRLISCRVRVDQRAENRAGTIPPVVRIELRIPGHKDLVVSHEPEHLLRKYQRPDLRNAIHEAFRIAQRRLRDLKE